MKGKRKSFTIYRRILLTYLIVVISTCKLESMINGYPENQIKNDIIQETNYTNSNLSGVTSDAIDLTIPSAKYLTGIDHYYGKPRDAVLYNNLSFVVTECGDLLIFNLTNFKPDIIGIWENKLFGPKTKAYTHMAKIVIKNSTAYLGLQDLGIVLINVSNPLSPTFIYHYNGIRVHDLALKENKLYVFYRSLIPDIDTLTVLNVETRIPKFLFNVSNNFVFIREIISKYGFIFKQLENSTKIFDVFQGEEVIEIGEVNHEFIPIIIKDNILIGCSSDYQLRLFNITNTNNPILLGNISLPNNNYYGAIMSDNLFYLWNSMDILTLNLSDIANPYILSEFRKLMLYSKLITLNGFNENSDERLLLYVGPYYGIYIYNFTIGDNPSVLGSYTDTHQPFDIEVENDILLICSNEKLEIYSVENPEIPSLLSVIESRGLIYDVEICDNRAILALGLEGIEIVDIHDYENPKSISYFNNFTEISSNGFSSQSLSIDFENKILYLSNGYNGIAILDINDYSKPILLNEFNPNYNGETLKGIYHLGKLYTGSEGGDWGLGSFVVYDVKEPENPIKIHEITGINSATKFYIDETHLYMYIGVLFHSSFRIYDLRKEISYNSNVSSIPGVFNVKDIIVQNNIAFISHGFNPRDYITIVGVGNKRNPKIIDEYHGQSSISTLSSIIIDKDTLYINEGWNGIHIFHIENWDYNTIGLNFISVPFSIVIIFLLVFKKKKKKVINC